MAENTEPGYLAYVPTILGFRRFSARWRSRHNVSGW